MGRSAVINQAKEKKYRDKENFRKSLPISLFITSINELSNLLNSTFPEPSNGKLSSSVSLFSLDV